MTIQQIIEGLEEDMLIAKNKFAKAEQKLEELKILLKETTQQYAKLVDKKKDEAIDKLPEL